MTTVQRKNGTLYDGTAALNSYAVERSATWSNWTTIRTDTANTNPMTVTDFATNRMNFYRIRRLANP